MKLQNLLESLGKNLQYVENFSDIEISQVSSDSRKIEANSLFCAVGGSSADGRNFIQAAIKNGAVAVMANRFETNCDSTVKITVNDDYAAMAEAFRQFHQCPDLALKLLGVTGTNGKTSSAYILKTALNRLGKSCGLISTVKYDDGTSCEEADRTTPSPAELFELFSRMKKNHLEYNSMELSSHALAQNRIGNAEFYRTIFTNLTQDHLDYHKTFENYYQAKKRLFTEHLSMEGMAIINIDDAYGRRLADELRQTQLPFTTFAVKNPADFSVKVLEISEKGNTFEIRGQVYRSNLNGLHNVYNLSGAIVTLLTMNFEPEKIAGAVTDIYVPGRLEKIMVKPDVAAFVDYAHTDDALKNVLTALRESCKGQIITVFGCGGDRDRTKRPKMGNAAATLSDSAIITSDNPRSEKPEEIIAEILSGIPADKMAKITVEADRGSAIKKALKLAKNGDFILIAGKGHENYQEINGVKHHFDDMEQLRNYINENI